MDQNFINQVRNFISPDTISELSSSTGESEANLEQGFNLSISTLLLGLANQGKGGLSTILGQAKNYFVDALDGGQSSPVIKDAFSSLLGSSSSEVLSSIQTHSGLSASSTNKVMEKATTAVFGFLKNLSPNFDSDTIISFLTANKTTFLGALPAGFSLAGLANVAGEEPVRPVVHEKRGRAIVPEVKPKEKGGSMWLYIILLLIAAALLYFFLRGKADPAAAVPANTEIISVEPAVDGVAANAANREMLKVTLPDGVVIDAYKGGIEDRLVVFLKTDYKALGENKLKDTWFNFDNLNFETNSAVITQDSKAQLANIVAILKAFPDAKLKLGGYTDKTGTEAVNLKLSGERANAVKKSIEDAGRGKQIDGAEGYGSKFAKYSADAPESDRVLDRHISVSVR